MVAIRATHYLNIALLDCSIKQKSDTPGSAGTLSFKVIIKMKRKKKEKLDGNYIYDIISSYWASEASPTLGCSIEISRDICMYICIYVCLSWSKKRRRNYVGQTRACSKSVLDGKIRPVPPVLFISTIR